MDNSVLTRSWLGRLLSRSGTRRMREKERRTLAESPAQEIFSGGVFFPIDRTAVSAPLMSRILNRTHERCEFLIARRMASENDTIVEIGSGRGILAARLFAAVRPRGYVCYEPNPSICAYSRRLFERNGFAIKVVEKALGRGPSHIRGTAFGSSGGKLRTGAGAEAAAEGAVGVEAVSLGKIIADHAPTMIIMDTEGMERAYSAEPALATVRKIVFETHPGVYGKAGQRELIDNLAKLGFERRYVMGDVMGFGKPGRA